MLTDNQVVEILSGDDIQAKYAALDQLALSQSSSPTIVQALENASHDEDIGVVVRAIKALQAEAHHRMALEMGLFGPVSAEMLESTTPQPDQPQSGALPERQQASPGQLSATTTLPGRDHPPAAGPERSTAGQAGEMQALSGVLPPPANPFRRGLALLVDLLILTVLSVVIALLFDNLLQQLGFYSRLIGAFIFLAYFSLFNSSLLRGATPGKRLLRLRVVSGAGSSIGLPKSVLRSSVITLLALFIGWQLPGIPQSAFVIYYLISLVTTGTVVVIFYLAIFNRHSGQSLDDLLVRSRVVYTEGTGVESYPPTSRLNRIFALAILLVLPAIITGEKLLVQNQLQSSTSTGPFSQFEQVLNQDPRFYMASVSETSQPVSAQQVLNLVVVTLWPRRLLDAAGRQETAREAAGLLLEYAPAADYDGLQVRILGGYDLGLFEKSITWFCAPPGGCTVEHVRSTILRYINYTQSYQLGQ
jgi:uncharacterized RDD family membrane protein YckC